MSNGGLHLRRGTAGIETEASTRRASGLQAALQGRLPLVISLLALCVALTALLLGGRSPNIAYVRSTELVYGYVGMKEAHAVFERKKSVWQSELDSMQRAYQAAKEAFDREAAGLSGAERSQRGDRLNAQEAAFAKRQDELNARAQDQDRTLTQGVLNQINAAARDFGKSHGYDVVLSAAPSGAILYGADEIDITAEVLDALNRSYATSGAVIDTARHE